MSAEVILTHHALRQASARRIDLDALVAMVRAPEVIQPDAKRDPQVRRFVGGGMLAIVNVSDPVRYVVLTAGLHGASRDDWEDHAARRPVVVPTDEREPSVADPVASTGTRPPSTRRAGTAETDWARLLRRIDPVLHEYVRAEAHGDVRRVRVVSRTEVVIT